MFTWGPKPGRFFFGGAIVLGYFRSSVEFFSVYFSGYIDKNVFDRQLLISNKLYTRIVAPKPDDNGQTSVDDEMRV